MKLSNQQLEILIRACWNDFDQLSTLAYEIQFRGRMPKERRAEVIARLIELADKMRSVAAPGPGFDFPTTDIQQTRAHNRSKLDEVDWQKNGLLTMSG